MAAIVPVAARSLDLPEAALPLISSVYVLDSLFRQLGPQIAPPAIENTVQGGHTPMDMALDPRPMTRGPRFTAGLLSYVSASERTGAAHRSERC